MRIVHLTDRLTDRGGAHREFTVVVLSEYMRGELVAAGLSAARIHVIDAYASAR